MESLGQAAATARFHAVRVCQCGGVCTPGVKPFAMAVLLVHAVYFLHRGRWRAVGVVAYYIIVKGLVWLQKEIPSLKNVDRPTKENVERWSEVA
eukprot:1435480-Amphidinium_carterae.1